MTRTRIVLADDHPDVAEQLRDLLSADTRWSDRAGWAGGLVEAVQRLEPDVIVADIAMPAP